MFAEIYDRFKRLHEIFSQMKVRPCNLCTLHHSSLSPGAWFQYPCRLDNKNNNYAGHFSFFCPRTLMRGRCFLSPRPSSRLPVFQPRYPSLLFLFPKLIRLFPRLWVGSCSCRLFRSANATREPQWRQVKDEHKSTRALGGENKRRSDQRGRRRK